MPLLELEITAAYGGKTVLRDLRLTMDAGETVGLVGRSGEGKSTIALSILGLLGLREGRCEGQILFEGEDLLKAPARRLRAIRGARIGYVPQSPLAALNPCMRLGDHLEESRKAHGKPARDWRGLLESVSLPAESSFLSLYPRQLSVGMAQRFLIGLAILHEPPLLIADEATSALDSVTQAEILDLFRRLHVEHGTAILYISHDLASVVATCGKIAVLDQGAIVEYTSASQVFADPKHPATRKLVSAAALRPVYT